MRRRVIYAYAGTSYEQDQATTNTVAVTPLPQLIIFMTRGNFFSSIATSNVLNFSGLDMDTNITPRSSTANTSNVTPRDINTTTKPDRLLSHPTVKTRLEKKMPLMALAMVPAFIAKRPASKNASRSAVAHSLPAEVWLEILNTASPDTLMAIARTCKKIYKCASGMPKAIAEVRHDIEFVAEHDLYNIQRQYQRGELDERQATAAIRDICSEQQYVKARTNWNAALVLNELAKCVEVRSVK